MAKKVFTAEQIIQMLREAEVRIAQGQTALEVCRGFNITEQTYYRWRKEYGGMPVNHKRVERIWRQEGLKVPKKQQKRGRIWSNDGSCIRLRPEHQNHVWSYDIIEDRTKDGRKIRILNVIDEYTREALCSRVERRIRSEDVCEVLTELFCRHGIPEYIRSDNGSEFTAKAVKEFLSRLECQTLYIEPGSPWENGYIESYNSRMRDELLDSELFYTLLEAQVLIGRWRYYYNTERPHSALGYRPPAPEALLLRA